MSIRSTPSLYELTTIRSQVPHESLNQTHAASMPDKTEAQSKPKISFGYRFELIIF